MMKKKHRLIIFVISIVIFLGFTIYNYLIGSQWIYDSIMSIGLIIVAFLISKWIKLEVFEFIFIDIALILHNLGTIGFYGWFWWIIQYDNVVHFVSSAVAAYIIFDFLLRKIHIKENQRFKKTFIDEHKWIFIIMVISAVAMLGVVVELLEFTGYLYLGEGDDILFVGLGDSDKVGDSTYQYFDTMTDIIVNIFGSIAGVLLYYFKDYKRKPWLKY